MRFRGVLGSHKGLASKENDNIEQLNAMVKEDSDRKIW
jgi:hypothetical protein